MATKKPHNLIGCHVSIAGGLWNAPKNAAEFGCESFQIFTRSPHGGTPAPITPDVIAQFQAAMKQYGFTQFAIHAPYIMNFGSANPRVYHGSIEILRGELERGSLIGADYVMFHPGSLTNNEEKGYEQAKAGFQKVLAGYKGSTKLLIENTAGAGRVIGATFEELADLMKPLLKHKGFGGICYDTQHGFGSGYDMRTPAAVAATFGKFDKAIGLEWLKMIQANDSKPDLGSHKDRHDHIAEGKIGKAGFEALLKYFKAKKLDIPLIFETEHDKVEADIKTLKSIRDKAWK